MIDISDHPSVYFMNLISNSENSSCNSVRIEWKQKPQLSEQSISYSMCVTYHRTSFYVVFHAIHRRTGPRSGDYSDAGGLFGASSAGSGGNGGGVSELISVSTATILPPGAQHLRIGVEVGVG